MKRYLVSCVIDYGTHTSFFNEIIECEFNSPEEILMEIQLNHPERTVTLINFWRI